MFLVDVSFSLRPHYEFTPTRGFEQTEVKIPEAKLWHYNKFVDESSLKETQTSLPVHMQPQPFWPNFPAQKN